MFKKMVVSGEWRVACAGHSVVLLPVKRCFEAKQWKLGLKYNRQILSNPKFTDHGGKSLGFSQNVYNY